ncbi:hypothetical protein [Rhodobacter ferrooxidans]|nr:hypothetical protein [Rhodobacter sp. SW2]
MPKSTIAQLLYAEHPIPNFARIVGELDSALERCPAQARSLVWDCEDTAVFELDAMRIVLAHADNPGCGYLCCLTLSVGPARPEADAPALAQRLDGLCRLLVERIVTRYPAEMVLWHDKPGVVTPDALDALLQAVPSRRHLGGKAALRTAAVLALPMVVANDLPDLPRRQSAELQRVREALYPMLPEPVAVARPSTQMRLATHAVNSTLIIVALPVGAALLTYSLLRGEDMRLSARAVALTGAVLGVLQSPLGQQVSALMV